MSSPTFKRCLVQDTCWAREQPKGIQTERDSNRETDIDILGLLDLGRVLGQCWAQDRYQRLRLENDAFSTKTSPER